MRPIRNLLAMLVGFALLGGIASAVSAAIAKTRLESRGGETDDEISLVTIYTGRRFSSLAQAFRGGSVLTWYGGTSIDLRGATLDPAGARLTVRTVFGGLRLVVPASWHVDCSLVPIAGGFDDVRETTAIAAEGPTLAVDGFALFGGVAIVSEAPDLDIDPERSVEPDMAAATEPVAAPA